ncbi:MAG: hypothetical protein QOF22_1507 [Bradyrhizobium sp.]|jgi:hypothetical protein|nr:hypothetical protein [Bradyrhizobium sp.]
MDHYVSEFGEKSRLRVLLDHFAVIEDPRPPHRVAFPLAEILLLVVCGTITIAREVDWLTGNRRFPGELRLRDVAAIVRVQSKAELKDRCRFQTRYYISSADRIGHRQRIAALAVAGANEIEAPQVVRRFGCRKRTAQRQG